jgi:SPP1 family predicted phage head-tail adaptor
MRAGRLRHRVTLQRATPVTVDGSTVTTWVTFGTAWGGVEPIRGREALAGGGILAEMDTRIPLRYNSVTATLTERDRLQHGGVSYNIYSIAEKNTAHRELECLCKSGVNDG